jgi:phage major head subunit gpT-like protein
MAIVTPQFLLDLNTVMQTQFRDGYEAAREASFYNSVATTVPSTSASNTYSWLGDFPHMQEWVGARAAKDMAAHGYAVDNKRFEATVNIPRTDIEDDQYGQYGTLARHMGQEAADHPDRLISEIIAAGASTLCYDGQNFFDTDHPVRENVDGTGATTTVSNYDATGGGTAWYLLDTRKVLRPFIFQERTRPEMEVKQNPATSDEVFTYDRYSYGIRYRCAAGYGFWQMAYCSLNTLDETNFKAARLAMESVAADGGRPMGIRPNLLLVPPALRSEAEALIMTQYKADGGSNPLYRAVDVLVSAWL